ncbi:MAG: hypothetical protein J2P53_03000 [Bradyrhizobiaceae bacterium]|nr:hypothetical protein [Bradyrhizobiaceae bacterium]
MTLAAPPELNRRCPRDPQRGNRRTRLRETTALQHRRHVVQGAGANTRRGLTREAVFEAEPRAQSLACDCGTAHPHGGRRTAIAVRANKTGSA